MKLFIVENELLNVLEFFTAIGELNWAHYVFPSNTKKTADRGSIRRFLNDVCEQRPDVVILDAALTDKEEKLLDQLAVDGEEVYEDSLSGFKYCQALASERLGIPIVFLTKYAHGQVARIAMRVGADRVLMKTTKNADLIHEIQELVKSKTAHDSAFYWPMRENLDASRDMWQGDSLRKALDRFFLKASNVRRFGLFTASLRGILSPLFQGNVEAEKKLMLGLVKSQVLLSLVDPKLRDHVKHTGNVFWMGYRLLHEILEFHNPESLSGVIPALYDAPGSLLARDQLLCAWTLAALFHDCGYVDERQGQLEGLVKSLLPSVTFTTADVRHEPNWNKNMRLLRDFVEKILEPDHFLFHFIDTVISTFGNPVECHGTSNKKMVLLDHGFLSAHRLMDMIPFEVLDAQKKNIVLHAALAIACHNYPEIVRKWKLESRCDGQLSVGTFPVCSLLSFCDNVQTWDREVDVDPAISRTEAYDGFLERLVLSDTAYVSGSEIFEFSTSRRKDASGYDLGIRLRYFVDNAGGVTEVCENLGVDIQRWIDSGKLENVCKMMGISSLLHGRVVYELPMLAGTHEITF